MARKTIDRTFSLDLARDAWLDSVAKSQNRSKSNMLDEILRRAQVFDERHARAATAAHADAHADVDIDPAETTRRMKLKK